MSPETTAPACTAAKCLVPETSSEPAVELGNKLIIVSSATVNPAYADVTVFCQCL